MKYKVRTTGATVELNDNNFKAKGGEGSIYIVGDTVYKVCDPGKMIADGKFKELAALDHMRIIRPDDVLLDSKSKPTGYTMKVVPGNPLPLAQILSKTYREREGVTPDMMAELVSQISEGIRYIHKKPGYLQVDGNELNYMVTNNHKDIYFIDVNSYQTPNFPADAIMPSIRDWNAGTNFTQLTDWYSFAIISFYMFTGIHPFKGMHPNFTNLKTSMIERMQAGISVLDKNTQFPQAAVYFPFEAVVPGGATGAYWQWYKAIFVDGKRLPAPTDYQSAIAFVAMVKEIIGSNNFDIAELRKYMGQITGYSEKNGREVVVTTDGIYVDNQPNPKITDKFRVGFAGPTNTPVALVFDGSNAKVMNLETQREYSNFSIACNDIMAYNGRLFVHVGQYIYELIFLNNGTDVMVMTKMIATVMPQATRLYNGVAIQDMFGARMVSVFPEINHHRQIKMDELVGYEITEARFENNVLMVIGMEKGEGHYTRFVFRFSKDYSSYDVRKIENITPTGINFTVLSTGVVICITEEEKVEIFSNQHNAAGMKLITDPAIKSNMRLCHSGTHVRFAHGEKIYSFAVRKTP